MSLNFRTGFFAYHIRKHLEMDPTEIRKNYMKSWFFIDLLATFPFDIFFSLVVGGGQSENLSGELLRKCLRLWLSVIFTFRDYKVPENGPSSEGPSPVENFETWSICPIPTPVGRSPQHELRFCREFDEISHVDLYPYNGRPLECVCSVPYSVCAYRGQRSEKY